MKPTSAFTATLDARLGRERRFASRGSAERYVASAGAPSKRFAEPTLVR